MENLKQIIKNIKLLVLDVDGVLTDGSLFYSKDGEHIKRFNVRDGQGIKLAQSYGIEIALVSARNCQIVLNRFTELGVKHIYQHCYDKAKKVKELCVELKVLIEQTAYIGDDILDVPVLEIIGLPICPKDAHPSAISKAKLITETKGGCGCVREVIDLILKEQGKIQI
jgi:3-deoxy-D-manno-octulosonate 8-phosphate phosphatase (KDO 8-P phosphatase)